MYIYIYYAYLYMYITYICVCGCVYISIYLSIYLYLYLYLSIYLYTYIYTYTLSAFCINVKYTLIIQRDIFFKSVIFRILRILHGLSIYLSTHVLYMYRFTAALQWWYLPKMSCGDICHSLLRTLWTYIWFVTKTLEQSPWKSYLLTDN